MSKRCLFYLKHFIYATIWFEILHLIKDNQGGMSLWEWGSKSHFCWQVGAHWEFVFYKKAIGLDFTHGIEINRDTNFHLKVIKEPQMSKKCSKYVALWNFSSSWNLVENCLVQTYFVLSCGIKTSQLCNNVSWRALTSKIWSLHIKVCFVVVFFIFMTDSFILLQFQ